MGFVKYASGCLGHRLRQSITTTSLQLFFANAHLTHSRAKCGHTYCGQCFRSTIETQLTTSLREFGTICEGPAPRISDGPAALAKRITDRGHHMYVAADIFSYACPSCRQKSQHPPIYSRKLGLFILAVKEKLGPQVVGDLQVAQEGPNDAGFFKPFFL